MNVATFLAMAEPKLVNGIFQEFGLTWSHNGQASKTTCK
jgi:hypothetical protein